MVVRELPMRRELAITMNRIWQRCSSECYASYLKEKRQKVYYKYANQLVAYAIGFVTLALLIAVAIVAWEEVVSLSY